MKFCRNKYTVQVSFLINLLLISLCKSFIVINKHSSNSNRKCEISRSSSSNLKLYEKIRDNENDDDDTHNHPSSRRHFMQKAFLASSSLLILNNNVVNAADNDDNTQDLTQQLYNPDGSLKDESQTTEVTYDTISIDLPSNNIRGAYKIPSKWTKDNYIDTSSTPNTKVCNSIKVFSPPSLANLKKATTIGVAKSLQLDASFVKSDLVSAKKRYVVLSRDDQVQEEVEVYDFDLAVAPSTCNENTKENLGLGFCPYEDIVLVSAVNWNDKTYVFQLECNREQWRKSNADLKDVRKSFTIAAK